MMRVRYLGSESGGEPLFTSVGGGDGRGGGLLSTMYSDDRHGTTAMIAPQKQFRFQR